MHSASRRCLLLPSLHSDRPPHGDNLVSYRVTCFQGRAQGAISKAGRRGEGEGQQRNVFARKTRSRGEAEENESETRGRCVYAGGDGSRNKA